MANRFAGKRKGGPPQKGVLVPALAFLVLAALFYFALENVGATSQAERLRSVERAISRATVQCYAVEGMYPPNLAYLEEHYGLTLDTDRYIIQYDAFASNMMPTILVLPRDFEEDHTAGGFADENGR